MAKGAEHWAREIVKARMEDNHALADSLGKNLIASWICFRKNAKGCAGYEARQT